MRIDNGVILFEKTAFTQKDVILSKNKEKEFLTLYVMRVDYRLSNIL